MIRSRLPNFVASLIIFCLALAAPKPASGARGGPDHNTITRMYVFGDSYSDIGEGYRDGNGPTAVAYLAQQMGLQLMPANDPAARGQSLDFAISGAQTGTGDGHRFGKALLGVGMRNRIILFNNSPLSRLKNCAVAFSMSSICSCLRAHHALSSFPKAIWMNLGPVS